VGLNISTGPDHHGALTNLSTAELAVALAGAWARQLLEEKDRRGSVWGGELNG